MIREAFGLIYAAQEIMNLRDLVDQRTVGALPIGGRYRVIDFPLSNMVNTGIRNVGVIASRNYNSLMDHIGSGKAWDLSRKSDGLFLLTPYALRDNPGQYRGMIEALKSSMDYIRRAKQEYCVLSETYIIYNSTFDEMMKSHIETGADITVMYRTLDGDELAAEKERYSDVRFDIDGSGRIVDLEIDPELTTLSKRSMKTYIIRKDILIYLVEECFSRGEYHFSENLLRNNLHRLKIQGFEHKGYVGSIDSVASYYSINMDLLNTDIRRELFVLKNRVLTKVADGVPARYMDTADVTGSLIANGCIIEGKVENSVIFRHVQIGKGASVKNSIILPGTVVGDDADLEYVILDKNVSMRQRSRLVGNAGFPVVIRKGSLV
ncbi:MAG: glucose-1-phosphate adenylyltransferase subunit GlgD [Clostridiales Family XIII bacterium]|jgi:glucose-1-phosphate adenylyltransferase|nr:glucose-1-phosphate adenylyltransferase subunit GlgD [Clostridiales Family XIII bacterium]